MQYLSADTLIGHDRIRAFLSAAAAGRRHHAYLFTGPEHVGKDTVARAFIGTLLARPVAGWEDLVSHPDAAVLRRADEKKNIGIEPMRGFLRHFTSSSLLGGLKVGVITGADDLSAEASNALLKTLEEPPGNALLLLTVDDLSRIPATVASRCQTLRFPPVPDMELRAGLIRRGVSVLEAEVAARLGSGRPGIAISFAESPESRARIEAEVAGFLRFMEAPVAERLVRAQEITADATPTTLANLLDVWSGALRDMVCLATGNDRHASNAASLTGLRAAAAARPLTAIVRALRAVGSVKRMVGENVSPKLLFEHIALQV